jgi:hypothetical protein
VISLVGQACLRVGSFLARALVLRQAARRLLIVRVLMGWNAVMPVLE